jgi:RNA ligase (TIGR02306 family)
MFYLEFTRKINMSTLVVEVCKYEGDEESPCSRFHKYAKIQHWANYPDIIEDGEQVVVTEKIHGKNCRVGMCMEPDNKGEMKWNWMAGSHGVQRKEFDHKDRLSEYWYPLLDDNIMDLILYLKNEAEWPEPKHSIIVFGELYGEGMQNMHYGTKNGFRVFDISINGKYLDHVDFIYANAKHGVEIVNILYTGPFSRQVIEDYTSGDTTMCPLDEAGKFKGREGIVIKPVKGRDHQNWREHNCISRVIFKSVSADYLGRKDG